MAYALGTDPEELIFKDIKVAYSNSKIKRDLLKTPLQPKNIEPIELRLV
jgi:hypothetical protein